MKIPASIRTLYSEQRDLYSLLKEKADQFFDGLREQDWHYEGRLKTEESLLQKIETGRFSNKSIFEDFFACTLVVKNSTEIQLAQDKLAPHIKINEIRPKAQSNKRTNSFPFDDLRIYAQFKVEHFHETIKKLPFEIQIKTYLQHAWSIATHDLIYKTDQINWGKERVAYQIKAMLEHAELSIHQAHTLSESSLLNFTDKDMLKLFDVAKIIKKHWAPGELPRDHKRLFENISNVTHRMQITPNQLNDEICQYKADHNDHLPLNLSPFFAIIYIIYTNNPNRFIEFLIKEGHNPRPIRIPIVKEIQLPEELISANSKVLTVF